MKSILTNGTCGIEVTLAPETAKQNRACWSQNPLSCPFRASVSIAIRTQGGAARLSPLRSALGWFVQRLRRKDRRPRNIKTCASDKHDRDTCATRVQAQHLPKSARHYDRRGNRRGVGQDGMDRGKKFSRADGFGQVIVHAGGEAAFAVA